MTYEQQPFLTCLVHETKKVIPGYVKVIGGMIIAIAAIVGIGYWFWGIKDQDIQLITGIVAIFAAVPWWAYAIITAILLPIWYAILVCIERRTNGGSAYLAIVITVMWLIMAVTLKLADEP